MLVPIGVSNIPDILHKGYNAIIHAHALRAVGIVSAVKEGLQKNQVPAHYVELGDDGISKVDAILAEFKYEFRTAIVIDGDLDTIASRLESLCDRGRIILLSRGASMLNHSIIHRRDLHVITARYRFR